MSRNDCGWNAFKKFFYIKCNNTNLKKEKKKTKQNKKLFPAYNSSAEASKMTFL